MQALHHDDKSHTYSPHRLTPKEAMEILKGIAKDRFCVIIKTSGCMPGEYASGTFIEQRRKNMENQVQQTPQENSAFAAMRRAKERAQQMIFEPVGCQRCNGTGYYGQKGDDLTVTLGEGAFLNGDIALTSTIKGIPAKKLGDTLYVRAYAVDDKGNYTYSDVVKYSPKQYNL